MEPICRAVRQCVCAVIAASSVSLPSAALAQTEDITPPVMTAFGLSATTIDTTAGPATVTVSCAATDDLAGLSHAVVNFFSPSRGQFQQAICGFDGTLNATAVTSVAFPQFSEAGIWSVAVEIFDRLSNRAAVDLVENGFPSTLDVISVQDTTAPTLTGFNLEPTSIDTAAGPVTVTVTCSATDDLAGLGHAVINFFSPSRGQFQQAICSFDGTLNATAVTSVTFPQFSETGTWVVAAEIFDRLSNRTAVDLAHRGFPSTVQVASVQDVTAPDLTGFSLSPGSINTAAGPATVTVTCSATDDLAGLSHAVVNFSSPSRGQFQQAICTFPGTVTATAVTAVEFPQFSEAGTWTVAVEVFDRLSNRAGADLVAKGLPNQLMVNNTLSVPVDIKPGSFPNAINSGSSGTIPVALLSADGFDAPLQVDFQSFTFGRTGEERSLAFCNTHGEDVNGDGRVDVICHFDAPAAAFRPGDTAGVLKGALRDGTPIKGVDAIRVVR